jgi:hypothetical protein
MQRRWWQLPNGDDANANDDYDHDSPVLWSLWESMRLATAAAVASLIRHPKISTSATSSSGVVGDYHNNHDDDAWWWACALTGTAGALLGRTLRHHLDTYALWLTMTAFTVKAGVDCGVLVVNHQVVREWRRRVDRWWVWAVPDERARHHYSHIWQYAWSTRAGAWFLTGFGVGFKFL